METRGFCTIILTPYCYSIFTTTEIILLGYLIEKKSVKEIAGIRGRSDKTIYNEIQVMIHKVNCQSQPEFLIECMYRQYILQQCNSITH